MTTGCVELSSNTATPPHVEMGSLLHRNYMAIPSKTLYLHTAAPSHQNGSVLCKKPISKPLTCYTNQRHSITHMHTPSQTSRLDLKSHCKTSRLNFGTFMAKLLLLDLTDGIMSEHRVDESSCRIDAS